MGHDAVDTLSVMIELCQSRDARRGTMLRTFGLCMGATWNPFNECFSLLLLLSVVNVKRHVSSLLRRLFCSVQRLCQVGLRRECSLVEGQWSVYPRVLKAEEMAP